MEIKLDPLKSMEIKNRFIVLLLLLLLLMVMMMLGWLVAAEEEEEAEEEEKEVSKFYISQLPIDRLCGCYWYVIYNIQYIIYNI